MSDGLEAPLSWPLPPGGGRWPRAALHPPCAPCPGLPEAAAPLLGLGGMRRAPPRLPAPACAALCPILLGRRRPSHPRPRPSLWPRTMFRGREPLSARRGCAPLPRRPSAPSSLESWPVCEPPGSGSVGTGGACPPASCARPLLLLTGRSRFPLQWPLSPPCASPAAKESCTGAFPGQVFVRLAKDSGACRGAPAS